MKRLKLILCIVFIILIGFSIMVSNIITKENQQLKTMVFDEIDMKNVQEGTYTGEANTSMVKVEVQVTVVEHQITNIEIVQHDNGLGSKAEVIVSDMISKNTYDVDTVSGATTSSTVIKSAVYKALHQGEEN